MKSDRKQDFIPDSDTRNSNADIIGNKMYGDNWGKIIQSMTELDPNFASFLKEIPYGTIYPREGLSLPKREIAAISVLTQLNLKPQLKSHILAALKVGISKQEILELFLHIAMFIGIPLVLDGLRVAKEAFDRLENKET